MRAQTRTIRERFTMLLRKFNSDKMASLRKSGTNAEFAERRTLEKERIALKKDQLRLAERKLEIDSKHLEEQRKVDAKNRDEDCKQMAEQFRLQMQFMLEFVKSHSTAK